MRRKWMVCMIACLMILFAGCNGNIAKETARNDTDKRISSTAGNTETTEPSQQEKSDVSSTAGSRAETAKSYESVQITKKPDSIQEQEQPQQQPKPEPETPPVKGEVKPTKPKPTEETKPSFDVNPYLSYAKSYAQGIGLELDSTATDCWDNPITANAKRTGIKDDIQSRLNRYKKVGNMKSISATAKKQNKIQYRTH